MKTAEYFGHTNPQIFTSQIH